MVPFLPPSKRTVKSMRGATDGGDGTGVTDLLNTSVFSKWYTLSSVVVSVSV